MSSLKPNIVFVCSRLDQPAGIERATVNLANLLAEKEYCITLLILDETATVFYPLHSAIQVLQSNMNFGISEKGNMLSRKLDFYRHVRRLKKYFKKLHPDFIIGTEYNLTIASWLAARKTDSRICAWEHYHIGMLKKNKFWSLLFKKIYPKLDLVICQNEIEKKLFEELGCHSIVIPNALTPLTSTKATLDKKNILTIGWLYKSKGVDLIPSIAEKIFRQHPDWHWTIIGKGDQYEPLQKEIAAKRLASNFTIVQPFSHDIAKAYRDASIYVMTSRFECLPMVLLEASSFGIPLVAFDCPTGPATIIHHAKDGFLIQMEDIDAMSGRIIELMDDEKKRKEMGEASLENSSRYAPERVYDLWKQLLEQKNKE